MEYPQEPGQVRKQHGIKGCVDPGGQAEYEPAIPPMLHGKPTVYWVSEPQQPAGQGCSFPFSTCEIAAGVLCLVWGSPAEGQPAHNGTSPSWATKVVLHIVTVQKLESNT